VSAVAGALATSSGAATRFALSSSAFRNGGAMPAVYSCDGKDVSPPLRWTVPPRTARSVALRVVDTDAGFTHWTAWGISPRSHGLASGQRPPKQGRNDFGRVGYGGPCPPSGTHHYVFVLYALARPLAIAPGASSSRFAAALRIAHVLAQAKLVGTYRR
jgi:Raf kinase inhibitor-like YbhB/YbcL family protein